MDMQYSRSEQTENKKQVRDNFNASIKYNFKNRSSLTLTARWSKNSFTNNPESSVFLIYSIPFNIPLWKKKNLGSIKGRILDLEDAEQKPLPRVLITANNATAISDENGEFIFPSLKPGVYALQVEQKTIGIDRITTERLPLTVEIEPKATANVEIGVVNSSSLTVEISVFGRAANSLKGSHDQSLATQSALSIETQFNKSLLEEELKEITGINGALVEITNGAEVYKQFTDRNGIVSFHHLRPGIWQLKVHKHDLPPHHYFENPEIEVEVRPGEKIEVTMRALPRHRPFKLIDRGEIALRLP